MKEIDYYFWINSDWAYLGADRLESLAVRHGVRIHYKPVDLVQVYSRTGGITLNQRSVQRKAYREVELKRWIRRLGIPLNITPRYMCPNADLASRFTIATDMLGLDVSALYKAILHAQWCQDLDISEARVMHAVADSLGLPGQRIMERALTDEASRAYQQYTDEAVARGVFGSPAYVFKGELFWGQDRLEFLEEAVAGQSADRTKASDSEVKAIRT